MLLVLLEIDISKVRTTEVFEAQEQVPGNRCLSLTGIVLKLVHQSSGMYIYAVNPAKVTWIALIAVERRFITQRQVGVLSLPRRS